jgi:hypothetical protein
MNLERCAAQMARQAEVIHSLTRGVSDEQARWRPVPESWSILEVVNHLYDEEREDFRVRLDGLLHRPDEPWPGIDPEGWVTERQYNRRNLAQSVGNFLRAREESLAWLRSLTSPDWQAGVESPFGRITAGDMLASWMAHDLLHTRQLVELHWAITFQQVHPFRVEYAGSW